MKVFVLAEMREGQCLMLDSGEGMYELRACQRIAPLTQDSCSLGVIRAVGRWQTIQAQTRGSVAHSGQYGCVTCPVALHACLVKALCK